MHTLLAVLLLFVASSAYAVDCARVDYAGNRYAVCSVDLTQESLGLYRADDMGSPYGHFSALEAALNDTGKSLEFAINAGMYHTDRAPVGHYIENGREDMRVISSDGPGNFGLLPNGVFCIGNGDAQVYETFDYLAAKPSCRHATQSGPMLVIDGDLHPAFLVDSTSRHIRNGVGTTANGSHAVFAISNNAVTFHEFGSFFRDHLNLPNALFLDGNVSRLHAPALGRSDFGRAMGPILAVTTSGS